MSAENIVNEKSKKNWFWRHKIISGILLVFVIIIIAAIADGPTEPKATDTQVATTASEPVFDVPVLMGKNVDDITKVLGKAAGDDEPTAQQLALGTKEWWKTYKKDGRELLVTYNPQTRSIVDFFISAKSDNEMSRKDMDKLLEVGNLKQGASDYSIEYVKALKDPSTYTGVKITPTK